MHAASGECVVPLIPSFMTAPLRGHGVATAEALVHPRDNPFGANVFTPGSLHPNAIILLRRGKVTFDTKVRNVEAAGGCVALVIVDSGDGASINIHIRNSAGCMDAFCSTILCGVTKLAGEQLIELAVPSTRVTVRVADTCMGHAFLISSTISISTISTDATDALGRTWLMAAAAMSNANMIAAARAKAGAAGTRTHWHDFVCLTDNEGDTALHHAARNGACASTVRLLLGGAPTATAVAAAAATRNKEGYSPLGLAAEYGRTNFVELLLSEFCADANDGVVTTNDDWGTSHPRSTLPLHHAAVKGFGDAVRALVRAGADTTAPNAKGETAAAIATGTARALLADPLADALQELVNGRVDMALARPAIEAALRADLGPEVEVVDVAANANAALGAGFVASARRMAQGCDGDGGVDPMLRMLWHGCGPGVLERLLKDGFKTSFSSLDFNVYGAGIYFAVDARLSTFFLTTNPKTGKPSPPDADGCYTLILAAVLLGRTGMRAPLLAGSESQKSCMELALKHPANRNPPVDCNSATGNRMKEVVLYENNSAFPAFTVRFRLPAHAAPLPDPYNEDERTHYSYLRALPDAPSGILPGWRDPTGAPAQLDKGGEAGLAQLVRDAKLIGGWDPAAALAEQQAGETMRQQFKALVVRNEELERQVQALRRTTVVALLSAVGVAAAAALFLHRSA